MPVEMIQPFILAWMEQWNERQCEGIDTGQIGAFFAIALGAAQRQIFRVVVVKMLRRNNVIDVERGFVA